MSELRRYLQLGREQAARVPMLAWMIAGVVAAAFAVVLALSLSGPPYVALYEGLTPAQGGTVVAQLQKLGIPYQLQAAGNIILVPAPQLAQARLQLGQAQVPQSDSSGGWDKLENAPMTTSDVAETALATRALEASLEQSIESMSGIQSAQVYLAVPPNTAFLADQPKPTASVVIAAADGGAQVQGAAIANLVAGAVPGLAPGQVTVETTGGVVLYPVNGTMNTGTQFQTIADVQNAAAARIATLLAPLVGEGNFRTNVSADVDFTQMRIHQIAYGPTQIVTHQSSTQSNQIGATGAAALGIPGALSNEPPSPTTANAPPAPNGTNPPNAAAPAAAPAAPPQPQSSHKDLDQTYAVGQSDSDIVKPNWTVKSIAVSVVLNKATLGTVTAAQVQAAIAGAFAYPVKVNVLVAPFKAGAALPGAGALLQDAAPISSALLEVIAALALLFGVALPGGRWLATIGTRPVRPALAPPAPIVTSAATMVIEPMQPLPVEYINLLEKAAENPAEIAKLLQSWVEEYE
ncbi:MAG TPA: flagellar M-ring protein FliF C-terminal domain-containing protein [Acidocella sp.]|uniref:flagellar M-ring protein FliF C-terminal domain-containing protein n=1 Tax=Acidocella sp. TaxID=50710 RepID=UPI002B524BA3|nr:flagellar M-ring protein FliF C-terminal domain-containing protein [Acidocella sp.]HVE21991.1 flagellar M-ring protein FliF C-terminal domain-containing protein [Acidocella sp.]